MQKFLILNKQNQVRDMNKIEKIRAMCYFIKSSIKFAQMTKSEKKQIKSNIKYKNKFEGQRCFILGNGPSLNLYDLSVLKHEKVFCVNEFVRHDKLIMDVVPDFYLMADPIFFELDSKNNEEYKLIERIRNLKNVNSQLQFFVPIEAKSAIEKYCWNNYLSVNYFLFGYAMTDNYRHEMDFAHIVPAMQAVVQYAIALAIYMGFKEIYLLGTDQTNVFGQIRAFLADDVISDYAFEMSESERKWKHDKLTQGTLPQILRGYARIFEIYDQLVLYCERKKIKLFNCAPETMIQEIQKIDFEFLFPNTKIKNG